MDWQTWAGQNDQLLFLIGVVFFLVVIFFRQNIKNFLTRKKQTKIEFVKQRPADFPAPKVPWEKVLGEKVSFGKNPVESVKNTIEQLDAELKKQENNVQTVLKEVLGIQTDIYHKMQDYYEVSQHLEKQEMVLRNNLEVLKAARPEEDKNDEQCPVCGKKRILYENELICVNCDGGKK